MWEENFKAYGARKLWLQLTQEGLVVVRCTVARLMGNMGLRRAVRGRGWRVLDSLRTELALDALDQALHDRAVGAEGALVHHGHRGAQYLSNRYADRLVEAGVEPSVGRVGDSYDNALAESIIGLYKVGPWRHLEAVEFANLEWVHWFNHRRLLEGIGLCPRQNPK